MKKQKGGEMNVEMIKVGTNEVKKQNRPVEKKARIFKNGRRSKRKACWSKTLSKRESKRKK